MKKNLPTLIASVVLAAAALAPQAAFAGPMTSNTTVALSSPTSTFSNVFTGGNARAAFSDKYSITTNKI
jgi:hypothetical protein